MQRAYPELALSPRGLPSPPSQQNKVILQREYREKEGECFNTLRDVIKDLTGEELRTRQEILRKAIDILLTALEMRRQGGAHVGAGVLSSYGAPSPSTPAHGTSSHLGYLSQTPSHWSQSWQSTADSHPALPYYGAHGHVQQHHHRHYHQLMSNLDSTFDPAASPISPVYGEDWSNYLRP